MLSVLLPPIDWMGICSPLPPHSSRTEHTLLCVRHVFCSRNNYTIKYLIHSESHDTERENAQDKYKARVKYTINITYVTLKTEKIAVIKVLNYRLLFFDLPIVKCIEQLLNVQPQPCYTSQRLSVYVTVWSTTALICVTKEIKNRRTRVTDVCL